MQNIKYKNGDIFDGSEDIIAHQVNGLGVMGGGIARQVKNKHPGVFKAYRYFVNTFDTPEQPLGRNLMVTGGGEAVHTYNRYSTDKNHRIIANIFGQAHIGTKTRQTDYAALRIGFEHLAAYAKSQNLSVAIPHGIGAGLGGGDWPTIESIIHRAFKEQPVTIYTFKP